MLSRRSSMMLVAMTFAAAACGSSAGDTEASTTVTNTVVTVATPAPSAASPTTAAPTTTTEMPTTTSTPKTFPQAAAIRLTTELGDAALAAQLVERLGVTTLGQMETAIGISGAADSLLLAIAPPTVPTDDVDSLIVYAFGNRVLADGTLEAGPVNQTLADVTAAFVQDHPVPVYAQWEIADLLIAAGVPNVTSIGREVDATGAVVYLSTAGVAAKAVELSGGTLGHVGVIGFADHAVRCVLTSRAAGMTADVPEGVTLPAEYDPESGQPWTTNRLDYLAVDLPARLGVWS